MIKVIGMVSQAIERKYKLPLFFLIAIFLNGCDHTLSAKTPQWEWYPDAGLKADLKLEDGMLTFRLANVGNNSRRVAQLLFDEEYLKETINVQIHGTASLRGHPDDIFNLSGDGLLGVNDRVFQITDRVLKPGESAEIKFNFTDELKKVNNPKLAEDLAKSYVSYSIILPINLIFLNSEQEGVIQFTTPPIVFK